jgi:LL-diaminopimelate aminotransferase
MNTTTKKDYRADRIKNVPPYLFARIDELKEKAQARGIDIISFGIGDPDQPTPQFIVDAMHTAISDPKNHDYPPYDGTMEFRTAVAAWYKKRFNVDIDPKTETIALIGSKEGIAHTFWALVNPGDVCLLPDPGYPVYNTASLFSGGENYFFPLSPKRNWLPDLSAIPSEVAKKAKLIFVNYPNNPTGATCDLKFFAELVEFAKKYDIVICNDNAYSETTFDGYTAPSILQVPGAKDISLEFTSLSKTFNMTGWRSGMVAGSADLVGALRIIKTNVDSGIFKAIQKASVVALASDHTATSGINAVYQKRRDMMVAGLNNLGWNLSKPKGTFYIWAPIPARYATSADFCADMIEKCGIVVVPGNGYGANGEGYFRVAITVSESRIAEGLARMQTAGMTFQK